MTENNPFCGGYFSGGLNRLEHELVDTGPRGFFAWPS
jgi:hypothetical protein